MSMNTDPQRPSDSPQPPNAQKPANAPRPADPQSGWARNGNRIVLGCAAALVVVSFFAVGAGIGFGFGRLSAADPGRSDTATAAVEGQPTDRDRRSELEREFDTFWEAMDVLYDNFYGELPAGEDATYDAIRGIVGNLDDPNTSFLSPEEADVFRTNLSGSFEGIGARVDWDLEADTVRIVEPFENQPAWNAGVRRDDLILAVNGESVVGTDLGSAVTKIRGPKGSTAVLTILRLGENDNEPFDIEVVRDTIETPTVTSDRLSTDATGEESIAYIRLYTFNENAGALVKQAVQDAEADGVQGIVFDLRGNSGGLLREAVKVSSLFLDDEIVLYERFKDGDEEIYRTTNEGIVTELPVVLLVNEGSASASEIVAGALQDAGRAPLIGATTFGKGSVQIPESLSDGSIMRVTIARWYTPENRTIDGTGLAPDFDVPLTDADREADLDPQLDRALREIEALITGVPFVPPPTPAPDAQESDATESATPESSSPENSTPARGTPEGGTPEGASEGTPAAPSPDSEEGTPAPTPTATPSGG
jgi:carboxyl-terminal processing protease